MSYCLFHPGLTEQDDGFGTNNKAQIVDLPRDHFLSLPLSPVARFSLVLYDQPLAGSFPTTLSYSGKNSLIPLVNLMNNNRRDLLPTRSDNGKIYRPTGPASDLRSGANWKTALFRNFSLLPLSCSRSDPIVKSKDARVSQYVISGDLDALTNAPDPSSIPPSPERLTPLRSPLPSTHDSLKSIFDWTFEQATAIYQTSRSETQSEINLLRSENVALRTMVARLQFERDVARQRIQMLSGNVIPMNAAERMLELPMTMGGKRKRNEEDGQGYQLTPLPCSSASCNQFPLLSPLPTVSSSYLPTHRESHSKEYSSTDSMIKRRRTSIESFETAYSSTSTVLESYSSPLCASPTRRRSKSRSVDGDFDVDTKFVRVKLECEDSDLIWPSRDEDFGEGEQDMDLGSECSDSCQP